MRKQNEIDPYGDPRKDYAESHQAWTHLWDKDIVLNGHVIINVLLFGRAF